MDNVCNRRLFSIPCKALFKFWKVDYYVVPTTSSNVMTAFVGSKERVRIPLPGKHCSLQAFVKHIVEHVGLRKEAQKARPRVQTRYKAMPLKKRTR